MSIYDLVIESKFYNNDKIADFENNYDGLRVGVLGGTFDPIHYAHLATVEFIRCKYKLDKIIFMPSGDPPHKLWNITNKYDRYNMVLLAVAKNKDFIAFNTEIEKKGKWLTEHDMKITSVYFGGGTPTSIEADEMDALYQKMFESFPHTESIRELTVEAGRPDTITPEKLAVLKKWGIDRISVNPQSYTDETLKAIGRHHTVQETIDKFWMARKAGMNNINMDLIIGLPNEGIAEFEHSLNETAKMMPESLTVHTLSFKRASEMTHNKEKYKVADRKTAEAMMHRAHEWTAEHGYKPYYLYRQKNILGNLENVGYSLPGEESIYNIVIMEEVQTIIGLGCGASTKLVDAKTGKISQYHNPKEPVQYIMTFEEAIQKKIEALNELYGFK